MPLNVAIALAAEMAVFAVLLFGGAGTLAWPGGWAFMALFFIPGVALTAWLGREDPALLEERMKPFNQQDQPLWDRVFLGVVSVLFAAWLLAMGLDRRFGWTHAPMVLQVVGGLLTIASWIGLAGVFRANTFLAPVVKVQRERGQHVVSTGPYAVVRHPMYILALLMLLGLALVAGSWWGVIGVAVLTPAIAWRAVNEERVLRGALEGYDAYAARVRYRLVPGVW